MQKLIRLIMIAAVAAATLASLPATGAAQSASPIAVQLCTVLQAVRYPRPFSYWYPWPRSGFAPYTDGLDISYVNTSNKPIDRALFLIDYRGDKQRVVDAERSHRT